VVRISRKGTGRPAVATGEIAIESHVKERLAGEFMQQRRVRLGDILDDYCPRERRVTNHVVVAMIEEEVKQTRCTTCDADHEYKAAKVPSPRRKKAGALAGDDVAGVARPRPAAASVEEGVLPPTDDVPSGDVPDSSARLAAAAEEPAPVIEPEPAVDSEAALDNERDEWPVHRPLIRATLPRPEGQSPERKATDFTMRPASGRFDTNRSGQRNRGHRPMRHTPGQPSGPSSRFGAPGGSGQGPRHGAGGPRQSTGHGAPHDQRQGNRRGPGGGSGGRPPGQGHGPRQDSGPGRKRGR
jgi:hypothetical protein